jgi:predicted nucleic-acid-binding protein
LKIVADANVLLRAVQKDDARQTALAAASLLHAEAVAVTLQALCEFVWVLDRGYRLPRSDIAQAIRELTGDPKVSCDKLAVEAGLAIMDAGGDFADGVIAFEGKRLGGEVFVTFDKQAAKLIAAQGSAVELLRSD